jgi:hypothetical protein
VRVLLAAREGLRSAKTVQKKEVYRQIIELLESAGAKE